MMSLALVHLLATAFALEGVVMADRDGNGAVSPADEPVAGALVFWEGSARAATDRDGRFHLDAPGPGIVWVRTPDGFSPAPVWRAVEPGGGPIALLLRPRAPAGPLRFIHTSDTHLGTTSADETRRALEQAAGTDPPPWFIAVTGDLTAGTFDAEFDALSSALRGLRVPLVPVVGNHDWQDEGVRYRRRLGPPMYSFDSGGVHFIVLNCMAGPDAELAFVDADLGARRPAGLVAAFTHYTPSNALAAELARRGVRYVFTGHSHDNRVMERGSLLEVNTEPAVMGGIDYTPAGWRVVELDGGRFTLAHHTLVEEPLVAASYPRPGDCVPPGRVSVIAEVELGDAIARVDFSLDGAPPAPLAPAGGWAWAGEVALAGSRWHSLEVRARRPGGQVVTATSRFCVIAGSGDRGGGDRGDRGGGGGDRGGDHQDRTPASALPDWPMLQGSAEHRGAVETELRPPLRPLWARAIGGHARSGAPVLAGGRLFVPVVDLADSRRGGLIALDARRGDPLWQQRGVGSVAASPAVEGDTVVFATTDGWLHAHRTSDGELRWKIDLAAGEEEELSATYAAPVIAGGRVYAGTPSHFVAVDLSTGELVASEHARSIWAHLYAAPAVAHGRVVVPLGRGPDSLVSLDADDLTERWAHSYPRWVWIHPSPIIDGDTVYAGNAESVLTAIDLASGAPRWARTLSGSWSRWALGTPALAHGLLFVPTPRDRLIAVEAASGSIAWSRGTGLAVTHPVSYQTQARGYLASPVVTGRVVWAGGIDGVLRALDARGGTEQWETDLGAPIVGGLVPAGDLLFAVTYDGTVRALTAAPSVAPPDPLAAGGCGGDWRWPIAALVAAAIAALARAARRRPGSLR
ncbi:MAG TPA: PQQ-binding-like beta-propeller repeat protein [Kofleriaceae bacterium]|nr:PQQ-binding-like beta-propeller repeat protein [Kofleriaceae bacterium]